jgi:hypothetical protein
VPVSAFGKHVHIFGPSVANTKKHIPLSCFDTFNTWKEIIKSICLLSFEWKRRDIRPRTLPSCHNHHKSTKETGSVLKCHTQHSNITTHLTTFLSMTPAQSLGRRDDSGQSNSSCATGTMFFLSLRAREYSLRTKSAEIGDCWPLRCNASRYAP